MLFSHSLDTEHTMEDFPLALCSIADAWPEDVRVRYLSLLRIACNGVVGLRHIRDGRHPSIEPYDALVSGAIAELRCLLEDAGEHAVAERLAQCVGVNADATDETLVRIARDAVARGGTR